MTTQSGSSLTAENLEVITCTVAELGNIKKITNGMLYHTSDTNEFYFDWGNRRHKLDVFVNTSSDTGDDIIKKSQLGNWLADNGYITDLSLVTEIKNIIGTDISNIITTDTLKAYADTYLLTKEEVDIAEGTLSLTEDIAALRNTDLSLFTQLGELQEKYEDAIEAANEKISSTDLNVKLANYITDSIAKSTYVSKTDANTLYINKDELGNYLKTADAASTYLKKSEALLKSQLDDDLTDYAKKIWVSKNFLQKIDGHDIDAYLLADYAKEIYLLKKDAKNLYFNKEDAEEEFISKQDASKQFVTTSNFNSVLSGYITIKNAANDYAKMKWVDQYFLRKGTKSSNLDDFALSTEVQSLYLTIKNAEKKYLSIADASSKYITIKDADSKFIDTKELNNLLSDYVSTKEAANNYAKMVWVDQYFLRKADFKGIENATTLSSNYDTFAQLYADKDKILQGFYYLNTDQNLVVAVDDKNGDRVLLNIDGSSIEARLYFGGDDVSW